MKGVGDFFWFRSAETHVFGTTNMLTGHGGNLREMGNRFGIAPEKIVDFSASVNPLGFPESLVPSLRAGTRRIHRYPDPFYRDLRTRIGDEFSLSPERIAVGNGSSELIHLLPRAVPHRRWLVVAPGYSDYADACRKAGKTVRFFYVKPEDGFRPDWIGFEGHLSKTDAVILGNPNNPTGVLADRTEILTLALRWEKILFVVDEAFIDFVDPEGNPSLLSDEGIPSNVVVIRSFTKIFGVPGLRLGFAAGSKSLIENIHAVKEPWTVNCFAEEAGRRFLGEKRYLERTRRLIRVELDYLERNIQSIGGFLPYPSSANFVLVRSLRKDWPGKKIQTRLMDRRILIRDCSNFQGLDPFYFRVAVRKRHENRILVRELGRCVD